MKLDQWRKSACRLGSCSAVAFIAFAVAPVSAQNMLEEVIVTAQKREQNLQDVPVAVSAFTGEALYEVGITDVFDLQNNTPGLIVSQNQNSTTSNFSIRGVGTSSQNFGLESSVGLYVDGVYRSRQSTMINQLVDVEAAEVLRGPQGTLFGKNTPSGAILIRTVAPSHDDTNGFFEFTGGEFGQFEASAGASYSAIPDVLAFRLTGFTARRDGYVDDLNLGDDLLNDRDRYGVRAQALWTPNDSVDVRIIADYSEVDEICCAASVRLSNFQAVGVPGRFGSDAVLAQLGGTIIGGDRLFDNVTAYDILPTSRNEDRGISMEVNWDLGSHTVTSVSAFRKFDSLDDGDVDFSDVDLLRKINDAEQESFSQEFRIANNDGDRLNYVFGAYYFTQDLDNDSSITSGEDLTEFINLGFGLQPLVDGLNVISQLTGGALPPAAEGFPPGSMAMERMRQDHESWAIFGQLDYNITDNLTATVGLRYTDESKDLVGTFTETLASLPPDFGAIAQNLGLAAAGQPFDPSVFTPMYLPGWGFWLFDGFRPRENLDVNFNDDQLTGTFKLSYFASDNLMIYASYGKGYKSGGTNTDRINTAFNPVFDSETADSFEVGFKADFPAQALRLNVAIHDTQVDDFQANSFTGLGFNLQNAGKLDTWGGEVEVNWAPTDTINVTAGYSKTVADYDEFDMGNCWVATPFHFNTPDPGTVAGQPFCDRADGRVSTNPEDFFVVTARKDFNVSDNLSMYALGEVSYIGDQSMDGDNDPLKDQGDYQLVNLRLGFNLINWDADMVLWVRNVFDEEYFGTNFTPPAQDGKLFAYNREPRTFGLTLRKYF